MTNWVKRFVKEAIMREELRKYGVMYRLENGKYYKMIVKAYSEDEAKRIVKRNLSDAEWHEFEPGDMWKDLIDAHNYLYVYDSVKAD